MKYFVILQKSVPVISDLISNSDTLSSFKTAMSLIFNAQQMLEAKMKHIKLANSYALHIENMKSLLISKIELKCIETVKAVISGENTKSQREEFKLEITQQIATSHSGSASSLCEVLSRFYLDKMNLSKL